MTITDLTPIQRIVYEALTARLRQTTGIPFTHNEREQAEKEAMAEAKRCKCAADVRNALAWYRMPAVRIECRRSYAATYTAGKES